MKKLLTLLALLASFTVLTAQTVPPLMNYQGRLTSDAGAPLADGTYRLAFRLYTNAVPTTDPANDPVIWGREYDVSLIGGGFNVVLGAAGAGPVSESTAVNDLSFAFGDANRFLELRIVRDAAGVEVNRPILPRQQLLSAPYALQAGRLIKEFQDALCPPGTIVAFGGTEIPSGWLLCDGRSLRRTQQPRLFAAIGTAWGFADDSAFNLPGLQGYFLRGVSGGTERDPDRNGRTAISAGGNVGNRVGSHQGSKIGDHTHGGSTGAANGSLTAQILVNESNNVHARHRNITAWNGNDFGANGERLGLSTGATRGAIVVGATSANNAQTSESRPVNAYVHYIIKY